MYGGESGEREGPKEGQADYGGHWEAGKLPEVLKQWAELWMCSRSWIIYALVERASARLFLGSLLGKTVWIFDNSKHHLSMLETIYCVCGNRSIRRPLVYVRECT